MKKTLMLTAAFLAMGTLSFFASAQDVMSVSPAPGEVYGLSEFVLSFDGEWSLANRSARFSLSGPEGVEIPRLMSYSNGTNYIVYFEDDAELTTPGEYVFTVPEGKFEVDNTPVPETSFTYTIVSSTSGNFPNYTVDPAPGNYDELTSFTVTLDTQEPVSADPDKIIVSGPTDSYGVTAKIEGASVVLTPVDSYGAPVTLTSVGPYSLRIEAGALRAGGASNESLILIEYSIGGTSQAWDGVYIANPPAGNVECLTEVFITLSGVESVTVSDTAGPSQFPKVYNSATGGVASTCTVYAEGNQLDISVSQSVTTPGNYRLVIPAAFYRVDGQETEYEISIDYIIAGSSQSYEYTYTITPSEGEAIGYDGELTIEFRATDLKQVDYDQYAWGNSAPHITCDSGAYTPNLQIVPETSTSFIFSHPWPFEEDGTYTLVIPAGYFTLVDEGGDGHPNSLIEYSFVVDKNAGPKPADAIYISPLSSQYALGTRDRQLSPFGAQLQPVDAALEWYNMSANPEGVSYSWSYGSGFPAISQDEDCLTARFPLPSCQSGPYDTFASPTLTSKGAGLTEGSYAEQAEILAGGKTLINGSNYGLAPFNVLETGMDIYTVPAENPGEAPLPIFGYSAGTDDFWKLYSAGGDPDNLWKWKYAYVTGIVNVIFPAEKPLVANGGWVYAKGKIDDSAQFTLSVYATNSEGELTEDPLASKTISGSDVLVTGHDDSTDLDELSLPFDFDSPAVMTMEGTYEFYVVLLTGFHDGGVEYFAPYMQVKPNPFELCLGTYRIEYDYRNEGNFVGFSLVANHQNEYGDMYCAFAIALDGAYPWLGLGIEDDTFTLSGESAVLPLNSYYPAAELEVTLADGSPLPAWLSVEGSGIYSNAALTFTRTEEVPDTELDLVISGVGVEQRVSLRNLTGVASLGDEPDREGVWYDLTGRRVDISGAVPGLYINDRKVKLRK